MRVLLLAFLVFSANPAAADESAAEFFARDKGLHHVKTTRHAPIPKSHAQKVIAEKARRVLGEQWVSVALLQAQRESGFNPNAVGPQLSARHGNQRARGIFQVLPNTARGMGFNPARLHELEYGIEVGVAYMARCVQFGVSSAAEMNNCFLYGYHRKVSAVSDKRRAKGG